MNWICDSPGRFLLVIVLLTGVKIVIAQKVSVGLNVGIYKSILPDIEKQQVFTERLLIIRHFKRRRTQNAYYDFQLSAKIPLTTFLVVGVDAGFYLNFRDKFFSDTSFTKTPFTTGLSLEFLLLDVNRYQLGIAGKGGIILSHFKENFYEQKNGYVTSGALYLKEKESGALVRLGIEQQVYTVNFTYPASETFREIKYRYQLQRVGGYISVFIPFGHPDF